MKNKNFVIIIIVYYKQCNSQKTLRLFGLILYQILSFPQNTNNNFHRSQYSQILSLTACTNTSEYLILAECIKEFTDY